VTPRTGADRRRTQARAQQAPPPKKPAGWTTLSGRGADHQKERREALARLVDGADRCPFEYCGHAPLYAWQELDLDEYPPRVIAQATGAAQIRRLAHASCNRRAGAELGNRLRKGKPARSRRTSNAQEKRRQRW
jgi:hypothetical protein